MRTFARTCFGYFLEAKIPLAFLEKEVREWNADMWLSSLLKRIKTRREEEFDLFASYAAYENYCLVGESCESQGRHDDNHKKYLQQGKENR